MFKLIVAISVAGGLSYFVSETHSAAVGGSDYHMASAAITSETGSETLLYQFRGCCEDGWFPQSGIIADSLGNLYGTTAGGGIGRGTVFELVSGATGYTEKILHVFRGAPDGDWPVGALLDEQGTLYGTTTIGGANNKGVVFKLTFGATGPDYSVVYSFKGPPDAASPLGSLVSDSSGILYGTAGGGTANPHGTVYELIPTRSGLVEQVVYRFQSVADGEGPLSPLVLDKAGALYGATASGGLFRAGTIFKIAGPHKHRILYTFKGGLDGFSLSGGLVADPNGSLYGTTFYGGDGYGTVFRLDDVNGRYEKTTVYAFKRRTDGAYPDSHVVADTFGDLYGATADGGTARDGTLFKLTPNGDGYTKSTIYDFLGEPDGRRPFANLVLDANGSIVGATVIGGRRGLGTIFKIVP